MRRYWEQDNWLRSRPGSVQHDDRLPLSRKYLRRPILVMLIIFGGFVIVAASAYLIFGYGQPPVSAVHPAVVGQITVDGTVCCSEHLMHDGAEYVLMPVLEHPSFFRLESRSVSLSVVRIGEAGELEIVSTLDSPFESRQPRHSTLIGTTLFIGVGNGNDQII